MERRNKAKDAGLEGFENWNLILISLRNIQVLLYLILVSCTASAVQHFSLSKESYWLIWSALLFSLGILSRQSIKILSLMSVILIVLTYSVTYLASSPVF